MWELLSCFFHISWKSDSHSFYGRFLPSGRLFPKNEKLNDFVVEN